MLSEVQVMTVSPSSKRVSWLLGIYWRQRRILCDLCHFFAHLGPDPEGEPGLASASMPFSPCPYRKLTL